ncbi:hypothetical protein SPBR_00529 [Sporothrix brasiliensis 5110]|uniref:Acyltransferase 3 domain-containing protein n=1 Tax=Sporothrix brasiliensis 5110 TaxID=1398154 RepID=A0A0C2ETH9_9PEZI|nr:uncharacterized protein SPBR_00529 [Sporothrix brasiliensis 5110]KIH89804.1 hypothetical protein SPBR_00529 [Sporothrix brasiliensis 5110]
MTSSGLLDGGNAPVETHELPVWRDGAWSNEKPNARPMRRFLRSFWNACRLADEDGEKKPLRPTAYLDGLRGFAAFLVYIHHNELWAHAASPNGDNETFENAFGFKDRYHFATLPFVRNFFTGGHIAVALFYVISGYVLCAKGLSLIVAGEHMKLLDSLASSVFRRWFRLYIPIFITTFLYVTSWHIFGHYWVSNSTQHATIGEEWWEWYVELKNFTFLFKEGSIWVTMNTHLWSIPFEMRGSMICFLLMLATYRTTHFARHVIILGLMFYFLYIVDGYYCCMFTVGIYFCYLDILAKRNDPGFPAILHKLQPYKTFIVYTLFVIGMFLAGVPSQKNDLMLLRSNPGWYYLSFLKPQAVFDPKWFYLVFAAGMIVGTTPHIPVLKRFFESSFCQYLGRISYSLYLVHGPVLASIGDRVYAMTGWYRVVEDHDKMLEWWINRFQLPKTGPMGLELNFLAPQIIIFPATFILANLVTKYVDEPAVRWPAKFYKWALGGDTTPSQPTAARRPEDPQRLE